ncbi:MAG: glycosyltransferase family 4 protein, partial [Thermoproteota archaeon]
MINGNKLLQLNKTKKITVINYYPLEFMGGGEFISLTIFNYLSSFFEIRYISSLNFNKIERVNSLFIENSIKFKYERKIFIIRKMKVIARPHPYISDILPSDIILEFLDRPLEKKFLKALYNLNLPIIFLFHGITFEKFNFKHFVISSYSVLIKFILFSQKNLLKKSNFFYQILNKKQFDFLYKLGISKDHIFYIPNGITFSKYYVKKNNIFRIIWIGRIEKIKGIYFLIKIIRFFNKHYNNLDDLEFLIIGTGSKYDYLKTKLKKEKNVKYLGFVKEEEKINLLAESELALMTSIIEPYSLVVLEYLASGLYVISTPISGPSEIISKCESFGIISNFKPKFFINEILNNYKDWKKDPE